MSQGDFPKPDETPEETMRRLHANDPPAHEPEAPGPSQGWGVPLSKPEVPSEEAPNPYDAPTGGWGETPPNPYQPYSPPNPGYAPPPAVPPYPGYGTPPPTYGTPPPGYGHPGSQGVEHPDTTKILIIGILGLVCCGILAPFAWSMGHKARQTIAANPQYYRQNNPALTAGWVLGIVGSVILVFGVLFNVLGLVFGSM